MSFWLRHGDRPPVWGCAGTRLEGGFVDTTGQENGAGVFVVVTHGPSVGARFDGTALTADIRVEGVAVVSRVAFALAGLGGNNAHGSGFFAAAQAVARERGIASGLLPGLEMISCTSGAIASTAMYLSGDDLRSDLEDRIAAARRARSLVSVGIPETPQQAAATTLWVGVPGVFEGMGRALPQHLWRAGTRLAQAGVGWLRPPTAEEVTDLLLPAQLFVPQLPDEFFADATRTLTSAPVGVAFNSYGPADGVESLYVNDIGLELIREYHDPGAEYDADGAVRYRRITPEGMREALWLFYYGFGPEVTGIDGAYARSTILDELTFADEIWAVRPLNRKWIGALPRSLPEVLDLQTELWMNTSYREQVRAINVIGRLGEQGRTELHRQDHKKRDFHRIQLREVELTVQRGFYTYFIEDIAVFDDAYRAAYQQLRSSYPLGK